MLMKIMNCDCMDLMKEYPDKHFELAIVDPPYRDKNVPTKDMREKGGKMDTFGQKPKEKYFHELFRVSKNQIIWGANNFIEKLYSTNCFIFWDKHQALENFSDGELAWTSFNSVAKKFNFPIHLHNVEGFKIHPTQKPVKLYRWLLEQYGNPGDKILDTHLGSGSIAIACHYMGYDLTACEIDKDYYESAMKRIKDAVIGFSLINGVTPWFFLLHASIS